MGTGYKLKGKAMHLFSKFKSNDEPANSSPDINSRISSPSTSRSSSPTKPSSSGAPPKGPRAPGQSHAIDTNQIDTNQAELVQSLDTLNLSGNSAPQPVRTHERYRSESHLNAPQYRHSNSAPSGQFIGGFNPNAPQLNAGPFPGGPGPLPRPPPMQFPSAATDGSLTMQYAQQQPPPPPQQLLTPYGGYNASPSRPYSAPAPPGFPHPASSPYPSPYPSPGSSPAHTPNHLAPQYLGQSIPAPSLPNFFPAPHGSAGRPLPASPAGTSYGAPHAFGVPHLPSSSTRPTLTTQFNSPSAGPIKKQGKPSRPRASSTPPTPTAGVSGVSGQTQCSGVTKAGKRCTRLVKSGPALVSVWGAASPTSGNVERFCHQHAKELLGPSGFYARKQYRDGRQGQGLQEWIDFADYIPPYLHPDTQVALRVEMEKPRSQSDVEGYIYTFEIRDPKDPSPPAISLKVGRAVNVVKRLNQWGKQCGSKEQVLRGWYPGEVDHDDDANDTVGQSLMKGRVKAGGRGVWCHRLERLVHLELADLAVHTPYLQPGWEAFLKGSGQGKAYATAHPEYASGSTAVGSNPSASASVISISSSSSDSSPGSPAAKGKGKSKPAKPKSPPKSKKDRFLANGLGNGGGGAPCKDCGQIHKEIFEFARVPKGPKGKKGMKKHADYYGLEWEGIVKKVVDEWGAFVENYV